MATLDWKKFLSVEIVVFALGSAAGGFLLYSDLKAADARLETRQEEQYKAQQQQYRDLKQGQRDIRKLLEQLMLEKYAGGDLDGG